jgi:hypothetical protein
MSNALNNWSGTAASNDQADYAQTNMASSKYKNAIWNIMADLKSHLYTLNTDTGSANACAIAPARALSAYFTGYWTWFLPANANTGACTLNVNSLGAKNIFAQGAALIGNELSTTVPALVVYDGTQLNLINPQPASGSFTVTATGFSTTVSGTARWTIRDNLVYLTLPALSGTSNSTALTLTNIPTAIQPTTTQGCIVSAYDNSSVGPSALQAAASSTWTWYKNFVNAWTSSGTKGIPQPTTLIYRIY